MTIHVALYKNISWSICTSILPVHVALYNYIMGSLVQVIITDSFMQVYYM